MNINFKFLLCGVAVCFVPQAAVAQCAVTDCQQLGYTSLQKCDNGLKCPFGEYWACPKVEEKAVFGQCTGYAKNCSIGQILNSDGTCTSDKVSGKTPIGVVVYIGGDNCGQALALQDLGDMAWSTEHVDIPDLPNYTSSSIAEQDFDSCGNTQKIIKQGNSATYPAAWTAVNYVPSSVPATKGKWCLPAAGIGRSMMNNYDKINSGLSKAGVEPFQKELGRGHCIWTSSEINRSHAWFFCGNSDSYGNIFGSVYDYVSKDGRGGLFVRPVLVF